MTVVFNRTIVTYRAMVRRAWRRADKKLDKKNRGVKMIPHSLRRKSELSHERIEKFCEENARLGLPTTPLRLAVKGLTNRVSRAKVPIALTPTQVKEINRRTWSSVIARKAITDAARARKHAIDAICGQGPRHPKTD